jgi:curved DNA-binding protein CbpA
MDPYKVLQVDSEAEDEVIQAAYRRLARKYHPDVAGPDGASRMTSINAAWELLRDPRRRAAYDRERLGTARRPPSPPGEAASGGAPHGSSGRRSDPAHEPRPAAGGDGQRPPEGVSPEWTTGRSTVGSTYDPSRMRAPEGLGAAGPPPGDPSGPVLRFGRYAGWSLGEISRRDIDYLEWLDRMPIGRPYREEIDAFLRGAGRRRTVAASDDSRRGLFRRR